MNDQRLYFCHYHLPTQFVLKITESSIKDDQEDDDIITFETTPDAALSLLSGETNSMDWFAINFQDDNGFRHWKLMKKNSTKNEFSKNDSSLLFKIPVGYFKPKNDVHIIINKKENLLDVYIKLETLYTTKEKKLDLYVTKENDPSFLLNHVLIDLDKLLKNVLSSQESYIGLNHARQRFTIVNFPNISIFTTKIFPIITMETIE